MSAVIWVRRGKHRPASANAGGSMLIQATVPTALGLFFTPWLLDCALIAAAGATRVAILLMFVCFRRGRGSRALWAPTALLYAAFGAIVLAWT